MQHIKITLAHNYSACQRHAAGIVMISAIYHRF
jgi:hypothetical protein